MFLAKEKHKRDSSFKGIKMQQVCDLWVSIFGLSELTQASEKGLGELSC